MSWTIQMSCETASAIRTCVESSSVSRFMGELFTVLTSERESKFELRFRSGVQRVAQSIDGPGVFALPLRPSVRDRRRVRRRQRARNRGHRIEQGRRVPVLFLSRPASRVPQRGITQG